MNEVLIALSMFVISGVGAWFLGQWVVSIGYRIADERAEADMESMPDDKLVEAILLFKD